MVYLPRDALIVQFLNVYKTSANVFPNVYTNMTVSNSAQTVPSRCNNIIVSKDYLSWVYGWCNLTFVLR